MNLPNTLTILRIFFVPFLVAVLVEQDLRVELYGVVWPHEFLALAIFLAAAATDLLDGYLARRWGQITTVGMLLDPIADKLLISAALISLVQIRRVPAWMAVLDHRPRVRRLRPAEHRRRRRIHHSRQRPGQDQDDYASDCDLDGAGEHPLGGAGADSPCCGCGAC